MKTYLISLEQDTQRRNELARRFPQTYPKMQWIQAINGKNLPAKEYFSYVQQYFNTHQKIITPSEVGCTLSHIKALEIFLEKGDEYCLILEDDIIGNDADLETIKSVIIKNKFDGLILCGGQIPFGIEKYKLYKEVCDSVYVVANFSKKYFYGTCCYVVNRRVAQHIVEYHSKELNKADRWDEILGKNINLYYMNVLNHPFEQTHSHIENERSAFYMKEKNFFKRVYKQGIFWKISNRIRNDLCRWWLLSRGYKQIHSLKPNNR